MLTLKTVSQTGVDEISSNSFVPWRLMDGKIQFSASKVMLLSVTRRTDDYDLLATDIQEKTPEEVKRYYLVFKKKWKQLAGMLI
jgi:hypothetical protein